MDAAEDSHDDTIEETVPEVCRVCLLGHMIMRDLFVENNVSSLSAKAMSFASVKVSFLFFILRLFFLFPFIY